MQNNFWMIVDAYFIRILGAVIGIGGCLGLLLNNPLDELFSNVHGLVFLFMMLMLGGYSVVSMAMEFIANSD